MFRERNPSVVPILIDKIQRGAEKLRGIDSVTAFSILHSFGDETYSLTQGILPENRLPSPLLVRPESTRT